jgi:putative flippase GtrA
MNGRNEVVRLFTGPAGRLIRYGFVGAGVAFVYTSLTVMLYRGAALADPTIASAAAFILTQPIAFLAHRRVTYADAVQDRAQWKRFGVNALSGFTISISAMKAVDLLGKPYWIALMICWILVPAGNYLINAIWVFRVPSMFVVGMVMEGDHANLPDKEKTRDGR